MSLRLEVWAHQHHVTKTVGGILGTHLMSIMSLRLEVWAHQHHVTKTGGLGLSTSCH